MANTSKSAGNDLQRIPGVGPSLARDLRELGYRKVADLENADAEAMYRHLMQRRGKHIDRCVLYVFRCAVYFASEANPAAEKLNWWNWKD